MNVDLISVLIAVVAVGVGLAGLMLASWRGVRHEMRDMLQEIRDMRNHMGRIDSHIGELRERMGHVEGLLKGLREVFVRPTVSDRVPTGRGDFLVAHWERRLRLGGAIFDFFLSPTGRGDFLVAQEGRLSCRPLGQAAFLPPALHCRYAIR